MFAMRKLATDLYDYRELLMALTYRDIRVKYKQAVMGIAWAFFLPLMAIASGILIRVAMAVVQGKNLELAAVASVMVKVIPWLMFSSIVGGASNSLISNMNLITKIYFPREVVPLSGVLSALFDFSISMVGLLAVMIFIAATGGPVIVSWSLLLLVPVLATLVAMAVGLGLLLSAANLFFRDVKYIVQVLLQFGVFFSLVYFAHEELGRLGDILLLNPVAPLLESIRTIVVHGRIDTQLWGYVIYSVMTAVVMLLGGSYVFRRADHLFAEYV